jgi:hypothetical protein
VVNVQNFQLRQFCQLGGDGALDFIVMKPNSIELWEGTQLRRNGSRQASVDTTKRLKTRQLGDFSGKGALNRVVVQPNLKEVGQFSRFEKVQMAKEAVATEVDVDKAGHVSQKVRRASEKISFKLQMSCKAKKGEHI